MTHLAKLKFSDKQRSQVKMTVEERLRHKLKPGLTGASPGRSVPGGRADEIEVRLPPTTDILATVTDFRV